MSIIGLDKLEEITVELIRWELKKSVDTKLMKKMVKIKKENDQNYRKN